jgi:hypothetical protein
LTTWLARELGQQPIDVSTILCGQVMRNGESGKGHMPKGMSAALSGDKGSQTVTDHMHQITPPSILSPLGSLVFSEYQRRAVSYPIPSLTILCFRFFKEEKTTKKKTKKKKNIVVRFFGLHGIGREVPSTIFGSLPQRSIIEAAIRQAL